MTHDEKIVEAVARALQAEGMKREGSSKLTLGTVIASDLARAAITAYQAEAWQDISTAPTLERVFVAGWQPRHGNVAGYWWVYEDTTDENGRPIDHPTATRWQPLPPAPKATP